MQNRLRSRWPSSRSPKRRTYSPLRRIPAPHSQRTVRQYLHTAQGAGLRQPVMDRPAHFLPVLHHDVVQHRQAEQKPQRHLEGTRPVTAAVQRTAAGALTCGSQSTTCFVFIVPLFYHSSRILQAYAEKGAPRVSGAPGLSSLQSFTVPSAWNTGSFSRNLMSLRSAASPSARTATRPVTVPPARATSCSMA